MFYKDFEDYLQEKHAEKYIGLDDDMPDSYNEWLSDLDADDFIHHANVYALLVKNQTIREMDKIYAK